MTKIQPGKPHLFVGLNWLGDVIMSFPALSLAAGIHGVDVLTRPHLAPLYELHPGVRRIWSLPSDRSPLAALSLLRRLRQGRYQTITVFPHSFRAGVLAFLSGGGQRIGYATQGRSALFHQAIPLPQNWLDRHESGLHCHLVEPGHPFDPTTVKPLIAPDSIRLRAVEMRRRFSLPAEADFVVIAPGAAFGPAKRWFPDRYAELARRLAARSNLYFLISGTAGEKGLTNDIAAAIGDRARDIGGATSLPELIALLSQARLLIANDSGTMHLAAILGTPVVVAVGSTDMTRTGPLGARHRLVIGESCHPPCRKPTCQLGTYHCLDTITVDRMEQACCEVLT